jgi:ADP-ribose pyrophosphatase YjhB (NUDIX family)
VALDLDEIQATYLKSMAHISPLLGVEALVRREGKILLMRRSDNGLWALPSGLVEVGESLASAAIRELLEETGLPGQAVQLLAMFDTHFDQGSALHIVTATFLVEASGEPHPTLEATEVGWFAPSQWPPLNAGQALRLAHALQAVKAGSTFFDPVEEILSTPQERSTAGEPPKDTEEVQAARQLLRTVVLGQLERKT